MCVCIRGVFRIFLYMIMRAKPLQSCPVLYNPEDCSLPVSSVHGILRETYWSGLPCPPPGDLSNPGIQSVSLTDALTGRLSLAPPVNCEKEDNFTFSSMIWMPFVSISRLVALVRLPVLCWVGTIRVATFVLFLILEEMFSTFHGWIWY